MPTFAVGAKANLEQAGLNKVAPLDRIATGPPMMGTLDRGSIKSAARAASRTIALSRCFSEVLLKLLGVDDP
jgi:hypothetical protein